MVKTSQINKYAVYFKAVGKLWNVAGVGGGVGWSGGVEIDI